MVIHFFKSRREERINFVELYDEYFDKMDNVSIINDEDVSSITINMVDFNFSYRYLITKRSRVSSIYKLNSDYVNVNMLVEIPLNIPQFLIRTILQQVDEMCKRFGLAIYYDQVDNIREFRLFDMLQAMLKERSKYLELKNQYDSAPKEAKDKIKSEIKTLLMKSKNSKAAKSLKFGANIFTSAFNRSELSKSIKVLGSKLSRVYSSRCSRLHWCSISHLARSYIYSV